MCTITLDEQLTIYGLADVCNSRNLCNMYVHTKQTSEDAITLMNLVSKKMLTVVSQ